MPKIWADTIDAHRRQVHDAVLDAAAELIAAGGPMSVTMSAIAERAGIGRATLYKYFPDVESILRAWHDRSFGDHLAHLAELQAADRVTLDDLLGFAATRRHEDRSGVVGTLAHALAGAHTAMPDAVENHVIGALAAVVQRLADRNEIRADVAPDVIARWVFHAIHAPSGLGDNAVVSLLAASLAPSKSGSHRRSASRRE